MAAAEEAQAEDNKREAQRANLLLAASIEAWPVNAPVRIRNLSETGAALEGEALPAPGTAIILRRLDLAVAGMVVWASGERCGVHFDSPTPVGEWVTGHRGAGERLADQARVDLIQAVARTGVAEIAGTPAPAAAGVEVELDSRLASEIGFVRDLIERLGDELTDEPVLIARHATALQSFDLAAQILAHVANVLRAGDRSAAIAEIGMEELRARLLGKPRG